MMKVYLFKDYLASIHGDKLDEGQVISEVQPLESMPSGLVEINGKTARVCMLSKSEDSLFIEYVESLPRLEEVRCADDITCPHCGDSERDSWECSDYDDARECGACGTIFSYERNVTVSYSSKVVEVNSQITELG